MELLRNASMLSLTLLFLILCISVHTSNGLQSSVFLFGLESVYDSTLNTTTQQYSLHKFNSSSTSLESAASPSIDEDGSLDILCTSFDPGRRAVWILVTESSFQRYHIPRLIAYSSLNDQILYDWKINNYVLRNIEFDEENRRILSVAIGFYSKKFEIVSIDEKTGTLASLLVLPNEYEEILLGLSSFGSASQTLYFIARLENQTEWSLITVQVASDSANVLNENMLPEDTDFLNLMVLPNDPTSLLATATTHLDNTTLDFVIFKMNVSSAEVTASIDFGLAYSEYAEIYGNSLAEDRYNDEAFTVISRNGTTGISQYYSLDTANLAISSSFQSQEAFSLVSIFTYVEDHCSLGYYEDADNNYDCVACDIAEFQDLFERPNCKDCPTGTFGNQTAQPSCTLCPRGEYQNQTKQTQCLLCDLGSHAMFEGSPVCAPCDPGYVSNIMGSVYCLPCSPGQHQNKSGQSFCDACEPGNFVADFGRSICSLCPAGSFTGDTESIKCTLCPIGQFNPSDGKTECQPCPLGGVCDKEGTIHPISAPGWYSSNIQQDSFQQCIPTTACLGNDTCAGGYEGHACAACEPGFYKLDSECKACPANPALRLIIFLVVTVVLIFLLLLLVIKFRDQLQAMKRTGFYASVAIAYSYYQLISVMTSFKLSWPDTSRSAIQATWIVNFNPDSVASECSFELGFEEKYILIIFTPFFVLGMLGFRYLLIILVDRAARKLEDWYRRKFPSLFDTVDDGVVLAIAKDTLTWFMTKKDDQQIRETRAETVNVCLTFFAAIYIFIGGFVLSYFDCQSNPDGTFTMEGNPELFCFNSRWLKLFPAFLFAFLFYVLFIPFATFYGIYKNRRHLLDTDVYNMFGMLYIRYKQPVFYWELVIMSRKLCIIIIQLFFNDNAVVQAVLGMLALAGFTALQFWKQPYLLRRHNMMELSLLIATAVFLLFGLIYDAVKFDPTAMDAIVILILVVTGLFVVVMFAMDIRTHLKARKVSRQQQNIATMLEMSQRNTPVPSDVYKDSSTTSISVE